MVIAGSESDPLLGGVSMPLVPCEYDLSTRDSLGESSFRLSLVGPLGIPGIGGVIFFTPCPLGGIGSRGVSRVSF